MHASSIPLRLTARAHRAQMLQHAIPGLYLIMNGVEALMNKSVHWLDWIGLAAGASLLFLLKREWQSHADPHTLRIGWFEVLAGIVILLEAVHKYHPGKIVQPATLTMVLGGVVILLGFYHGRVQALRRLTLTGTGFTIRIGLLRSFSGKWAAIQSVTMRGNRLVAEHTDGTTSSCLLRRIENKSEVLQALQERLPASESA